MLIYNSSDQLIINQALPVSSPRGTTITLGNLGNLDQIDNYTFSLEGESSNTGTGQLRITFSASSISPVSIQDTILIVGV